MELTVEKTCALSAKKERKKEKEKERKRYHFTLGIYISAR